MKRRVTIGALVLAVAIAGAGTAWAGETPTYNSSTAGGMLRRFVTRDKADNYSVVRTGNTVRMSAPAKTKGDSTRVVFWPQKANKAVTNGGVCATWSTQSGPGGAAVPYHLVQQGLALRVQPGPRGRARSILILKNVFGGNPWVFNVLTVDSRAAWPTSFPNVASIDLASKFAGAALPWRMCAEVTGLVLRFKVWPLSQPEPAYGTGWGTTVTLPAGWDLPGRMGWYIGHLPAGYSATFTNLRTWKN